MNIGQKILLSTTCSVIVIATVSLFAQRSLIERQGVEMSKEKMRAMLIEAEDVREKMSELAAKGAFDFAKIESEFKSSKNYTKTLMYKITPVIASIETLEDSAKKENMDFRAVGYDLKKTDSELTAIDQEILDYFHASSDKDYYKACKEEGHLVYARPIYATSKYSSYPWNRDAELTEDGKDILGFEAPDQSDEEIRGVFILTSNYETINNLMAAGVRQAATWVIPTAIIVIVGMGMLVRTSVIKPLRRAMEDTNQSTGKTKETSDSIAQASRSLTDGATQQAAALEETSASLEEISASSKNCSQIAQKASDLANNVNASASQGNASMEEMVAAMHEIRSASSEVSQVIKTIEEIAFQTNILAINASIEAARVGELGAGFATVAEEVRHLAGNAAKASQETARLIKNSNDKSEMGVGVCMRVTEDLKNIVQLIGELSQLVSEVEVSSSEQRVGVEQISQAILKVEQVAQSAVMNSEMTFEAAQSLDHESKRLGSSVDMLDKVVNGS